MTTHNISMIQISFGDIISNCCNKYERVSAYRWAVLSDDKPILDKGASIVLLGVKKDLFDLHQSLVWKACINVQWFVMQDLWEKGAFWLFPEHTSCNYK